MYSQKKLTFMNLVEESKKMLNDIQIMDGKNIKKI